MDAKRRTPRRAGKPFTYCPKCGGSALEGGAAHHWPGCPQDPAVQARARMDRWWMAMFVFLVLAFTVTLLAVA